VTKIAGQAKKVKIRFNSKTGGAVLTRAFAADIIGLMEGILNLDKPPGLTSARAVDRVKRLIPRGIKIGHAGTLDPFATGVLLILIGKATKACERLMDAPKQYEATIKFGATTETDDPESPERSVNVLTIPSIAAVETALIAFRGEILQRPPAYSALKVGGQRAYDVARKGQAVALEPRKVAVYAIELLSYAWPLAQLRIDCGRGTYIRAIARDLGAALGVGGYLTQLRRTWIGSYDVTSAVTLERLTPEGIEEHLLPVPH
jgi:tRNA pseudouridine55 synthase